MILRRSLAGATMIRPSFTLYYNGNCSKCRNALAAIQDCGVVTLREYLKDTPSFAELNELFEQVNATSGVDKRTTLASFVRTEVNDDASVEDILSSIVEAPIGLQRPILVHPSSGRAVIGRPTIEPVVQMAKRIFEEQNT